MIMVNKYVYIYIYIYIYMYFSWPPSPVSREAYGRPEFRVPLQVLIYMCIYTYTYNKLPNPTSHSNINNGSKDARRRSRRRLLVRHIEFIVVVLSL